MVWYFVIGTLAAFGALCVLWVLFGALLPFSGSGVLFCLCRQEESRHIARRYRWLRDLGLVKSRLIFLTEPDSANTILQQEWEKINGTGIGDSAGHGQCSDLSEL